MAKRCFLGFCLIYSIRRQKKPRKQMPSGEKLKHSLIWIFTLFIYTTYTLPSQVSIPSHDGKENLLLLLFFVIVYIVVNIPWASAVTENCPYQAHIISVACAILIAVGSGEHGFPFFLIIFISFFSSITISRFYCCYLFCFAKPTCLPSLRLEDVHAWRWV